MIKWIAWYLLYSTGIYLVLYKSNVTENIMRCSYIPIWNTYHLFRAFWRADMGILYMLCLFFGTWKQNAGILGFLSSVLFITKYVLQYEIGEKIVTAFGKDKKYAFLYLFFPLLVMFWIGIDKKQIV